MIPSLQMIIKTSCKDGIFYEIRSKWNVIKAKICITIGLVIL